MANTIDYPNKVSNNGATAAGLVTDANMNEIKTKHNAVVSQIGSYKIFKSWYTQSGTNAPVPNGTISNLGYLPAIGYGTPGVYFILLEGTINPTKLDVILTPKGTGSKDVRFNWYMGASGDNTLITIKCYNITNSAFEDNLLVNTPIEIRIYE